eukprot:3572796-Rhodomonas_salina.1
MPDPLDLQRRRGSDRALSARLRPDRLARSIRPRPSMVGSLQSHARHSAAAAGARASTSSGQRCGRLEAAAERLPPLWVSNARWKEYALGAHVCLQKHAADAH